MTAPTGGAKWLDGLFPIQCCIMSRSSGTVKVAPVEPATKTRLSNCLKGRILENGPSMMTDLPTSGPFEEVGRVGKTFSAYLKNLLVAPFFARTTNSTLPSCGRLAIVNGWEDHGAKV